MAFSGLRFKFFGVYPQNLNRSTTKRLVRRLAKNEQATMATDDQAIDELETHLLLSPGDDAPDVPRVLSAQRQRQLFVTVAAGVVFVVTYGSGALHM